jgi:membrane protein YdbS with pleckstrin-like domain
MLIGSIIRTLFVLAAASAGAAALQENAEVAPALMLLPLLVLLLYPTFVSPVRRYHAWGYRMDEEELRLQHGIYTQVETLVPLKRVQHLDISQGPLERSFGVCRLILHTAGTAHSQVALPGLSRETAEAMRDEIRTHIRQEPE